MNYKRECDDDDDDDKKMMMMKKTKKKATRLCQKKQDTVSFSPFSLSTVLRISIPCVGL